jgi:chemotaxis protein methyltransferase CheR
MKMTMEEYQLINDLLSDHFGLYFPESKKEILEARLKSRLASLKLKNYMDYYFLLQYNSNGKSEFDHLARMVTNNESYFFREIHQFEALFEHGLNNLKKTGITPNTLRFLVAGCSTGEEPYTLNIYSKENQYRSWGYSIEINAIDIDMDVIQFAKEAEYGLNSLRCLDSEKTNKYFMPSDRRTYSLKQMFRTGVTFNWGNILKLDTYQKHLPYDVIFCRNVLIYFSDFTLHKVIENFARCLKPGGLLFLGHSESIIGVSKSFEAIRLGNCIAYRRVVS